MGTPCHRQIFAALDRTWRAGPTRVIFAALTALATCQAEAQDASRCMALNDDAARLACYDLAAGRPISGNAERAQPVATPETAPTPATRSNFAVFLEQHFLKNGSDMSVFSIETADKAKFGDKDPKHFPILVLFAALDRPFVFQMITTGKILEQAQNLGFRTVDFMSKGNVGHFFFDIPAKGSLPRCDRVQRVCY